MDEIEYLTRVDGANGKGEGLRVEVVERVLRELSGPMKDRETPRLAAPPALWVATGLSWAAAAACLLLAIQSLTQLQDPFSDLFHPLTMVLR